VLHDPAEIDGLTALCVSAPRPPEDPMASVYRALGDPSLDLAAWAEHWRDIEALRPAATTTSVSISPANAAADDTDYGEEPLPTGQLGKLRVALEVAKELWRAQEAETSLLSLVVLLAEPGRTEQGDLNLDGDGAALVIQPGSLVGKVMCLPLQVTSFAVCIVVGGGTSTSARRAEMVGRLREKALASGGRQLRDIRDLVPHPANPARPLAVLVHGLFATDVGTFKGLQLRLEEHFEVVGFPHDTLSESIEANGFELASRLAVLGYPRICCIAHSRGGLVARSAAIQLAERTGNNMAILRCATFGTPHLGAEMAENPGSLIATVAFLKADLVDKSVASLVDMLCCVAESCGADKDSFPGIRDLRPASTGATWLAKLQAKEGLHPDAKMQFFAVGGAKRPASLMQRIAGFSASRIIGRKPSDLVVTQSSSLPVLSNPNSLRQVVNCDHFSYFGEDQQLTLDQVVGFLRAP
jgi:hypothetical protein